MLSELDKRKNRNKRNKYAGIGKNNFGKTMAAAEDAFGRRATCPMCERRIFDVSDIPDDPVRVRLKCPHCRKIVKIPISTTSQSVINI